MEIQQVGVVGLGAMGSGIVNVVSKAGIKVVAVKATGGDTGKAKKDFEAGLDKEVGRGKLAVYKANAAKAGVTWATSLDQLKDCDLIIESIVEELDKKNDLFGKLDKIVKPSGIFTTNTSTIGIDNMAKATKRADKFAGLHFFNPAPVMGLVEVISGPKTAKETADSLVSFCKNVNKTPVPLPSAPGFIVNRLLVPYLVDSIRLYEQGVSNPADIDAAMKLGCNHPMGPFELSDYIGLDIVKHMADILYSEMKEDRLKSPPSLVKLVAKGDLGRKTGKGYYDYSDGQKPNPDAKA